MVEKGRLRDVFEREWDVRKVMVVLVVKMSVSK